jgi:hypothetical protein
MTDAELEVLGRTWAAAQTPARVPFKHKPDDYMWMKQHLEADSVVEYRLDSVIYGLVEREFYPTESAAYIALGAAIERGRKLFGCECSSETVDESWSHRQSGEWGSIPPEAPK